MPDQSVRFNAEGEGYTRSLSPTVGTTFTVLCWARIASDRDYYTSLWCLDSNSTSTAVAVQTAVDGTAMRVVSGSGTSQTITTMAVGTWYCFAVTRSALSTSTGTVRVHYGTDPDALSLFQPTVNGQWATQATFNTLRLGGSIWAAGEWLNGNLADVKVYTRVLSDSEIVEELKYYQPVSTASLYAAYPFSDGANTTDASGNGHTLSGGAGASSEAGPGIAESPTPADPPGAVFDLTNWKVTLPTDGGDGGTTADEIEQPALDTYSDANFQLDGSNRMVMTAPAVGATTSGSDGTRSELREMENGGTTEAAWSIYDTGARRLTVTGIFNPDGISGGTQPRKEMIIGQIHGELGSPPVYLSVEWTSGVAGTPVTPRLRIYKYNGTTTPGLANTLSPLTTTSVITYRLDYVPGADPAGGTGRLHLYTAFGTVAALPGSPDFTWAPADFFGQDTSWYFKAGAYNKSIATNGNSGAAIATISFLELIQPGGGSTTYDRTGAAGALAAGSGTVQHVTAAVHARTGGGGALVAGSGVVQLDEPAVYDRSGGGAALAAGTGARSYVRSRAGGGGALAGGSGTVDLTSAGEYDRAGGGGALVAGSGAVQLDEPAVHDRTGGAGALVAGAGDVEQVSVTIYDRSGGAGALVAGSGARQYLRSRSGGGGVLVGGTGTAELATADVYDRSGGAGALVAGTGIVQVGGGQDHARAGGAEALVGGSGAVEVVHPAVHDRVGGAGALVGGSGTRQYVRVRSGGAGALAAGSGAVQVIPAAVHVRAGAGGALAAGAGELELVLATVYARTGGAGAVVGGDGAALVSSPTVYDRSGGGAVLVGGTGGGVLVPPAVHVRAGGGGALAAGSGRAKLGDPFHSGQPYRVGALSAGEPVAVGRRRAGAPYAIGRLHAGST